MKKFLIRSICLVGWLKIAAGADAPSFSLEGFTIGGGGGISSGATYTLSGTIGQPDAGTMSSTRYTLEGGFWPAVVAASSGGGPTLFIQPALGSVTISWSPATSGFGLEQTDSLDPATWTSAPTGNPVTIPATTAARFYRLRKP